MIFSESLKGILIMRLTKIVTSFLSAIFLMSTISVSSANEFTPQITAYADEVSSWLSDPAIVSAIEAQNTANAGLTQGDIDALDKTWRAETSSADQPLIKEVLGREISKFLSGKVDASGGLITEAFVMDNKGLNVGQSGITSDYWQGDEGKWQNTYSKGVGAVDIGDVELDESTQTYQSQLSITIVNGSGAPIGAITLGLNVELL